MIFFEIKPDMPLTREDAVYVIAKMLKCDDDVNSAEQSILDKFPDNNTVSNTLKQYTAWGIENELICAHEDGKIDARNPINRAEFAVLIYRAYMVYGFNK